MILIDLIRLLAEPLEVAVVLTDIDLDKPGPTILYANAAFEQMSGYAPTEIIGRSPRLLQGAGTKAAATRLISKQLRTSGRFLGRLQNYRKSGEAYLCEIDVRALRSRSGELEAFIAFEREVVRRRGRPAGDGAERYRPLVDHSIALAQSLDPHPLFVPQPPF